jgi:type I restriction enzyme R subunit
VSIDKAVSASPTLRSKKDLIQRFIELLSPSVNVDKAWPEFIAQREAEELDAIIEAERLDPDGTREIMRRAFRDGRLPTTGTDMAGILPRISRFTAGTPIMETRARVLERLQDHYDRFADM